MNSKYQHVLVIWFGMVASQTVIIATIVVSQAALKAVVSAPKEVNSKMENVKRFNVLLTSTVNALMEKNSIARQVKSSQAGLTGLSQPVNFMNEENEWSDDP